MKGYVAFTKKEFLEQTRTFRMFILFLIFFIFGMMSPLMAKLMPEILSQMPIEGVTITLSEPTAIDSYMQFFKNITQMGMIVLALVFSGTLSQELSRGTLINMLTKGLSRYAVILSKFTVASVLWSLSLFIAFLTTYAYTAYFFSMKGIQNLFLSVGCLWLFGIFLLAVLLFVQTISSSQSGGLLLMVLIIGLLFILNLFPSLQHLNPLTLVLENVSMLESDYDVSTLGPSIVITVLLTGTFLVISLAVFKNKRI